MLLAKLKALTLKSYDKLSTYTKWRQTSHANISSLHLSIEIFNSRTPVFISILRERTISIWQETSSLPIFLIYPTMP